ncbi:MAG: DUF4834 family protein [Chlorobi bacterium]|nr:DUF4834 family protein [Chlorobiota bacterium]
MQLLRTILIIVLVYYLFKFIARYAMPWIARYFLKKTQDNLRKQYENQNEMNTKKEGEVHIDSVPKKKTTLNDVGEYVDYEEIEESD